MCEVRGRAHGEDSEAAKESADSPDVAGPDLEVLEVPLKMPLVLSYEDAFWHACTGTPYEPTYVPVRWDRDCPRQWGGYLFNPDLFRDHATPTPVFQKPITEMLIVEMEFSPWRWSPKDPYYQKNHASAPGTVRSWFRKMRAADFERQIEFRKSLPGIVPWHWTLFDTQQVVDRETAAHYLKPDLGALYFVQGGRVVGKIENIDWSGTPAALMGVEPTTRDEYLGIDRSTYPQFSSKVQSANARGITREDLQRFVDFDDLHRSDRR